MAKHFILKVTKVTYSAHAPWMVRVPSNLWDVEGQKKKFFATEAVAKAYKDRLSRSMVNYQLQAAALTDAQRLEAFECFAKLEPLAASLRAAVDHYVACLAQAGKSLTVRDLVAEFLVTKKQDDMSQRYLNDLKSKLGRFVGTFGETLVCDVSAQQLDGWLRRSLGSPLETTFLSNISARLRGLIRTGPKGKPLKQVGRWRHHYESFDLKKKGSGVGGDMKIQ